MILHFKNLGKSYRLSDDLKHALVDDRITSFTLYEVKKLEKDPYWDAPPYTELVSRTFSIEELFSKFDIEKIDDVKEVGLLLKYMSDYIVHC